MPMETLLLGPVRGLSGCFTRRRLREEDIPAVLALCEKNDLYYRFYPPPATEESLRADMAALPPGKTAEDKYYLGYFSEGKLAAVLDLVLRYPDGETAFIGFFMVDLDAQGLGLGSSLIGELEDALRVEGFTRLRLAWVEDNPQAAHFWKKNGLTEIKRVGDAGGHTLVLAEKNL